MSTIELEQLPNNVEMESLPCPLGCPAGNEFVLKGRDRLHDLPGEFNVIRCKTCGLMRTDPRPTPESIGFYYPESYRPWARPSKNNSLPKEKPIPAWKRTIKNLLFGKPLIATPPLPSGKLLEIGCGSGSFLHSMALKGWQVQGIEYSAQAGEAVRELRYPIHVGPLESAPGPENPVDLIVGWQVLEHLHDPLPSLKKMAQWVKPNGYLVLSTPDAASFDFKLFKHRWYALQLPTHLYHFTPKTADRMLKAAGWKVEKIFHERNIGNLIASLGYFLQDYLGKTNGLANYLEKFPSRETRLKIFLIPVARILASLGQTGRMIIWAKRMGD